MDNHKQCGEAIRQCELEIVLKVLNIPLTLLLLNKEELSALVETIDTVAWVLITLWTDESDSECMLWF